MSSDRFGRAPRAPRWASVMALALCASPWSLGAQGACVTPNTDQSQRVATWSAPLDRLVAVRAQDVSLRDALDRLSAAGHVRFAYSAEVVPLDRPVCLSRDSIAIGDALAAM